MALLPLMPGITTLRGRAIRMMQPPIPISGYDAGRAVIAHVTAWQLPDRLDALHSSGAEGVAPHFVAVNFTVIKVTKSIDAPE